MKKLIFSVLFLSVGVSGSAIAFQRPLSAMWCRICRCPDDEFVNFCLLVVLGIFALIGTVGQLIAYFIPER